MKIKQIFLAIPFLLLHLSSCYAQPSLSKKEWLEDLATLEKRVYQNHVNPFWKNQKSEMDLLFASVKEKINNTDEAKLEPEIIMTYFTQILSQMSDGHSGVTTKSRNELFGLYNYNLSSFTQGLYVTRTDESNKSILGSKVIKIDGMDIKEVKEKVISVSTSYNEQAFKRFSNRYLESPTILYGLEIAKSSKQVTLTLEAVNGSISTITFNKTNAKEQGKLKMITLNDIAEYPLPLYRQNLKNDYWFVYQPEKKYLYLNYIAIENNKKEPIEEFTKKLAETVAKEDFDKFIIDLRLNAGGDHFTAWPLLDLIMSNPKINKYGTLFVITGSTTFSAATSFLEALDCKTECILAGTPPSDSPTYPAEDITEPLPNCKMEVRISDEMWNYSLDDDTRIMIEPDLSVPLSFSDYTTGKDPVLDAILNYKTATVETKTPNADKFIGRFLFGIDKTLEITNDNGVLKAIVKGRLNTILIPDGENRFKTCIKGVYISFKNSNPEIHYPDGQGKVLSRLAPTEFSAFDLLLSKKFDKATEAYTELKKKYPDNININGANLAGLAFYYLVETKNFEVGNALLKIATTLNPKSRVARNLAKGVSEMSKSRN